MNTPTRLFIAKFPNDKYISSYDVYDLLRKLEKHKIKRSLSWLYSLPIMKVKIIDNIFIIKHGHKWNYMENYDKGMEAIKNATS